MFVSEVDQVTELYTVVDQSGYELGKKGPVYSFSGNRPVTKHMKPDYDRRGRRIGGRCAPIEKLFYKGNPPWFKYEIFKIDTIGGKITLHVRKE